MDRELELYQQSVIMEMEDWLYDPISRDSNSKKRLTGLAAAVIGIRAALNNCSLHSDEFRAVCKILEDFALLSKEEAASLTYFASVTDGSKQLEELSIEILTQELSEGDFLQLLDRFIEVLEVDGTICTNDAALLIELHILIKRCIKQSNTRSRREKIAFLNSVQIFVDSILEDVMEPPTLSGLNERVVQTVDKPATPIHQMRRVANSGSKFHR